MITKIGYIPYLNMVPFHQGFGPKFAEIDGQYFEFVTMSPRVLGQEAQKGTVDAGALSLVDALNLSETYEPLGPFGIGLKRPALSVLVFSKKPFSELSGECAVTDETSTSLRLLQVLLEMKYNRPPLKYGRIASLALFDGNAESLLLIGDEALKAKKEGVKGLPIITDLGEEWYSWQGTPFVFARWMVKRTVDKKVKSIIAHSIQNSLYSNKTGTSEQLTYWHGFSYKLRPEHDRTITRFAGLMEKVCLPA
jgi:chorismate dehydratase